ncbi:MAG TPA: hypothetical protein PK011_10030, partial [Marinagarivorans sp.]|nr:hypothetical protein [Marinagarivorans sp.]
MISNQIEISEDERKLLIEMTDFGVPLYEVLSIACPSYRGHTGSKQIEIARNLVLGLMEKGLVGLCRLTPENTKDHVYELSESIFMSCEEVKTHLISLINWEKSTDSLDCTVSYELAPTSLGEKVLDEIFSM